MKLSASAVIACVALLSVGCHRSGPHARHERHDSPPQTTSNGTVEVRAIFTDDERRIILSYYEQEGDRYKRRKKGLPPGLAKRQGNLPPGLAKKETLPPGLQRQILPYELVKQLPPTSPGTERCRVGDQAVLIDVNTHIVLDMIDIAVAMRL
jgi:hypothetical protein